MQYNLCDIFFMQKALNQITTIFSGYTFRSQLEDNPYGDTHVIQFRDAEDFVRINPDSPMKIKGQKLPAHHLLTGNDVLFLAKSQYNYAIPYQNEFPQAVASSMFLILRVTDDQIYPPYLGWYLNQWPAQQFLKSRTEGTYIKNIAKKDLRELSIPIPSIGKQHKIAEIYHLQKHENELLEKLKQMRAKLQTQKLLNAIKAE